MFNSITTKNLPQTRVITKYSVDEASIEQLALDAASASRDAIRGLRGSRGVIYSYVSASVTSKRTFMPGQKTSTQTLPPDRIDYYDGEEWLYVEPEMYSPCLSNLKLDPTSLNWSEPTVSEKEQVGSIDVFKEVELTFSRGLETKTKRIYLKINVPVLEWSETSIRVKRWSGSCVSASNATCEDFGEFEIGQVPTNQINCGNGYIIIKNKHESGSVSPINQSKIVKGTAGLECEKYSCCAECEDYYNSFETLLQATEARDSEFPGYDIIEKTFQEGEFAQNLSVACQNLTCYSIVAPQVLIY